MRGKVFAFLFILTLFLGSMYSAQAADCPATSNIVYGDYVQCDFVLTGDMDFFNFPGEAGDRILLLVKDSSSWMCSFGVDPRVEVRDPDGSVLYSGSGCDTYLLRPDAGLPVNGQYKILVSGGLGSYAFSLERLSNPVGEPIMYGDHVSDQIEAPGVVDLFTFYGCSGDLFRLQVTDSSSWMCGFGVDPVVEMFDTAGNLLASGTNCNVLTMDNTLIEESTHSFYVRGGVGNYDISFNVIAGGACIPYWLQTDLILNAQSYVEGDTLIVSMRIVNGAAPATVDWKVWVEDPNGRLIAVKNQRSFTVGFDSDNTYQVLTYAIKTTEPRGTYKTGGHLTNIVTGKTMALDQEQFDLN